MKKYDAKLNIEQGKRLKKCLNEKQMSQTELAKVAGYTKQYISNLAVGRKNFTIDSARVISKILQVREEYLLCEDDYKTDRDLDEKWHQKFKTKDDIAIQLLTLAGYEPVCDFIRNWNELELDKFEYEPESEHDNITNHLPSSLERKLDYATEIIAPNGCRFYCDMEDIHLLGYELIEYIHLRMKQLESKYAWQFDDARFKPKSPRSEISFYNIPSSETSEYFDLTSESGMWMDHDSDSFPDIDVLADIHNKNNFQ